MNNIASSLRKIAHKKGDETGLIEAKTQRSISFAQLEADSDKFAWYLQKHGVKPGSRVILMVKPSAEFICLTFAIFKIGATVILIDPGMGYKNLLRCISRVSPDVFIGIPKAHVFIRIFKKSFSSVKKKFCCGNSFGIFGKDISRLPNDMEAEFPIFVADKEDLAAIIFTTGSTGPPKGVRYEHSIFSAQLKLIRDYYAISENDIDQPAFPLFALFSTALGACAVIPEMDPTQPAKVNPKIFVDSAEKYNVSYSFGSPALWRVVAQYCHKNNIRLSHVKKVLMAGAPVSGKLIEQVQRILPSDARIFTPYGATECLPIVSIEGHEVVNDTWHDTQQGKGTCVGRALPGINIRIIAITDKEISHLSEEMFLKPYEIGEIIVSGNVVTQAYDNNPQETSLAKTLYEDKLWHRMGDTGYVDEIGRVWFCGRKAHRVQTRTGTKYTIQCEAIINQHDSVYRSALVGVPSGSTFCDPVLIIELEKDRGKEKSKIDILEELHQLAKTSEFTQDIEHFLFHDKFPVDIRHNAKIFREKLAVWAEKQLSGK